MPASTNHQNGDGSEGVLIRSDRLSRRERELYLAEIQGREEIRSRIGNIVVLSAVRHTLTGSLRLRSAAATVLRGALADQAEQYGHKGVHLIPYQDELRQLVCIVGAETTPPSLDDRPLIEVVHDLAVIHANYTLKAYDQDHQFGYPSPPMLTVVQKGG